MKMYWCVEKSPYSSNTINILAKKTNINIIIEITFILFSFYPMNPLMNAQIKVKVTGICAFEYCLHTSYLDN